MGRRTTPRLNYTRERVRVNDTKEKVRDEREDKRRAAGKERTMDSVRRKRDTTERNVWKESFRPKARKEE